jgi:hypothetical protein
MAMRTARSRDKRVKTRRKVVKLVSLGDDAYSHILSSFTPLNDFVCTQCRTP